MSEVHAVRKRRGTGGGKGVEGITLVKQTNGEKKEAMKRGTYKERVERCKMW